MLGFSVYLNQPLDNQIHAQIRSYHAAGFTGVFTSLHIPEDDPKVLRQRLATLVDWCAELDLTVVADVSQVGLARMNIDVGDVQAVASLKLTGLRIDDGVEMATVARLSRVMMIALNASTLSATDITELQANKANFEHLEAWHNYYPRPETGLDRSWFETKNQWLHTCGFKTMAFIPGDLDQRGPIFAGLPTLEEHREQQPFVAALDLLQLGTDRVYVGDVGLTATSQQAFRTFAETGSIALHLATGPEGLSQRVWHNRPDVARDVIRLQEGRVAQLFETTPIPAKTRVRGSITLDNQHYARYAGELQITRRDLPRDPRVNVIGQIAQSDLALLPFIGAGQAILFLNQE